MKKYLFAIILLVSVVLISGCTTGNQTTTNASTSIKTYNGDQFNFNYPATWQLIISQAQNSDIAVGDPSSADSSGNVKVNVEIQTVVRPSNETIQDYYNSTYAQFAAQNLGYRQLSDGNITVNGRTALENVYILNSVSKEQRAVWIQNGRNIYIILCSAPISQYNNEQGNFDTIINSFKLI
ncbi:MAG TPA: PsbP-related protein [Methanobacterium sp.]|nr:PsbP-related protein [Methanobacterium sp.]